MLPWSSRIWILISTGLFFEYDFIQSGINLSDDQSPPPITFPALATLIKTLFFFLKKYELMYDCITNSAEPFEAL